MTASRAPARRAWTATPASPATTASSITNPIFLPLSDDGKTVNMILVYTVYGPPPGRL